MSELQELSRRIASCPDCDLCKSRTRAVAGEGPEDAEIMSRYHGRVIPSHGEKELEPLDQIIGFGGILSPGEVLFIPKGWSHQVEYLENALMLTCNFVNDTNIILHLMSHPEFTDEDFDIPQETIRRCLEIFRGSL